MKTAVKSDAGKPPTKARPLLALLPLLLLVGLVAIFLAIGPAGIFPGDFPPVEDLTIQSVSFTPGQIQAVVTNGGPEPVTIAQVLVDDAYWEHTIEPNRRLARLKSSTIEIPYPWVEGDPVAITLISSTGITFSKEVAVATESPKPDTGFFVTFALLGIYIGVVPVLLGMTTLPFLRTLSPRWIHFFMALTAGVLIFLGVETLDEAIEQSSELPSAAGGIGIITVSAIGAFAVILAGSRMLTRRPGADERLAVAYAVALGIGLHNLGEGLAVGAAYRLGEIALGAFLVIGFAIHNTTEGLGIVSLLGNRRTSMATLAALGMIAGAPTIVGAWTGAFIFNPTMAALFLGVAAGAIAEVVVEVLRTVRKDAPGGLVSVESLLGITVGLLAMYLTGLLIPA